MKSSYVVRCAAFSAGLLLLLGCGGKSESDAGPPPPKTPKAAASQMDAAFQGADAGVKQNVAVATTALQQRDYEAAVAALQALEAQKDKNFQQGEAIRSSLRLLQSQIIDGVSKGDPKAQHAADMLRAQRQH